MELNELHHKAIIRAGDSPFLLDEGLSFLVIEPIHENEVSKYKSDGARYTLYAMYENILFGPVRGVNEINNPIKQTFYILVLRILEEKGEVAILLLGVLSFYILKPVLAIVPSAINDLCDILFDQCTLIFGNFLTR